MKRWQQHVAELASSLQVPEAVAKMDPEEGRHDESLQRYEDYFVAKIDLDAMLKVVDAWRAPTAPTNSSPRPTKHLQPTPPPPHS